MWGINKYIYIYIYIFILPSFHIKNEYSAFDELEQIDDYKIYYLCKIDIIYLITQFYVYSITNYT